MGQTNAVILARVSSKAQEDEGYSLDSQVKLLSGYCQTKGLEVVKVFKIAETASKQQSRKVFNELLQYISKNDICHLAVEKTDRFTRNMRDAVAIDDWLDQDENRRLHAVKENLLLHRNAKSDVKFMWNIHLSVAKKYTDNLREEAMKGWAEKLAQGWLPSVPPPGYITVTRNGKRIHVLNKATMGAMRKVFRVYLEPNHSILTITEFMKDSGIVTRKGRPYSKSHVHKLLSNPFYIGINRFDGKDYPGAQEPLISKELFDAVQKKLHNKQPMLRARHNPILKNMIRCQNCGAVVTWERHKERYYGACQRKQATCKGLKFLREDRAEELVVETLRKLICPSQEIIKWTSDAIRAESQSDTQYYEQSIALINSKLGRIDLMDETLYDDKLAGDISKERYEAKHAQLMTEKTNLLDQLDKLESSQKADFEGGLTILELSQKAADMYAEKVPEQKRVIITELFENLTTNGDTLSVTFTKFTQAIAKKTEETVQFLQGQKVANRTFKKTSATSVSEGNSELINQLRPIWQGRQDSNLQPMVLETTTLPIELLP